MSRFASYRSGLAFSLFAALLGCLADGLLLYHPSGGYHTGDYLFLKDLPPTRLLLGFWLGMLALPGHLPGLWATAQRLRPAVGERRAVFIAGLSALALAWGLVYHALVPSAAALLRLGQTAEAFRYTLDPAGALLACLFVPLSAGLAVLVIRGKTDLPIWTVWLTPMPTYLIWILFYLFVPAVGNYVVIMGFNLSMAIWYGLLLYFFREK